MNEKIEVSALIRFDNIKIMATAKANNNVIKIHEEKINLSNKNKDEIKKSIKKTVSCIEKKTSSKVEMINIIFDDFMKNSDCLKISTKIVEDKIEYENEKFFSKNDKQKIIESMIRRSKNTDDDLVLISVVPFKFFFVESGTSFEVENPSFPLDKKISKLRINFSIRYMDKKSLNNVINYFDSSGYKVNNIALESQLVIYDKLALDTVNKTNFVLAVKDNKTVLISNANNIAIKTDNLNYTFENLVKKIAETFDLSYQEAKNLINCYGELNVNKLENNQIIYSSYSSNSELSKPIRCSDITDVIKSFLKSICLQANEIIKSRCSNFSYNLDLMIVGKLSKINDLSNYCSKHFEKVNVSSKDDNESIYSWNESYQSINNYWIYLETVDNKVNPNSFYYNNSNKNIFNRNNSYKREQAFNSMEKRIPSALLA